MDEKTHRRKEGGSLDRRACLYCKGRHTLDMCSLLEKRAHNDKIAFLKEHRICFGCLCMGHIHSMLHIHLMDKGAEKNQAVTDTDTAVGSAHVAA